MSNQLSGRVEPWCPPISREPLSAERATDLGRMFRALGDPMRLRMLSMVASHQGGEACVCDISPAFDLTQPTISHHLKVLREAGLLDCERRGTWVYYRVVPAALEELSAVLAIESGVLPASYCAPDAISQETLS
ncbi:ArsR/SmtB family transcription factor [Rhodococcus sp. NPDC058639]|uniref:ArsR/SmtB family transcription factor n=1 Tax=Rhodococcus sp. NPDC058639 TaxID=3346570 RepID=UPI0036638B67